MNVREIKEKKVALLVADGFEQSELEGPLAALRAAGAQALIVSPSEGRVRGWKHREWGEAFPVDVPLSQARAADFDALVLPGGVMNPDTLRMNEQAVAFVRGFLESEKPIAAICHGPWTLINAEGVEGRRMTSYPSIRKDLENAGALWVDREVVVDNGIVTSRSPADLPAFNTKMIEEIAEGPHPGTDRRRFVGHEARPM